MRVQLGGFEVEVKAKLIAEEKFSKQQTLYFINELACAFSEAAKSYRESDCPALARRADEISDNAHDFCAVNGLYDNQ